MKIAITADFLDIENIGGAGRVIVEIARGLVESGHEVAIVAGGPHEFSEPRTVLGVPVHWSSFHYDTNAQRGISFFLGTRRRVRRAWSALPFSPDRVVHNQPFTAYAIGAVAAPVTYLFHSPWALEYLAEQFGEGSLARLGEHGAATKFQVQIRRRIERRAIARAEHIVCLSESMKGILEQVHGSTGAIVEVHPGGVDLERFQPIDETAIAATRQKYNVPPGALLFCSVRRMIPRTGLDTLLRALATAGDALGPYRLVLPGSGSMRDELIELTEELGLSDRVLFPGYIPDADLPLLYAASDLSIVPTRSLEGFGLSTLESLSAGTPVIATPVGGSVEILRELDARLLANKPGVEGIAERLRYWTAHRNELSTVARWCRPYVVSNYSWESLTNAALGAGTPIEGAPLTTA